MSSEGFRLRRWVFLLCVLSTLAVLVPRGLHGSDEPRVTAVVKGMDHDGDFVVPHIYGVAFVEKPPLYFAVATLFVRATPAWLPWVTPYLLCSAAFGLGCLAATYVLARRLQGDGKLAAALLATMFVFVENMGTMRVDIALAFAVTAALAAFAEAYLGGRPVALCAGAFLTGLALLSKGLIGPILIALGWAAVVWQAWRTKEALLRRPLLWHVVALLVLLASAVPWMVALRYHGGQELWDEWFWRNQFGRADGTAGLGHVHGVRVHYYVMPLLTAVAPFWPLLVVVVLALVGKWHTRTGVGGFVPIVWVGLCLLLLTVASTKRSLYILPLVPATAVALASAVHAQGWRMARFVAWIVPIAAFVLAFACLAPWIPAWPTFVADLQEVLPAVNSWRYAVLGLLLMAVIVLNLLRRHVSAMEGALLATVCLNVANILVIVPGRAAIDDVESQVHSLTAQIEPSEREHLAAFDLSELQRIHLQAYDGPVVPLIDREEARLVLQHRHPRWSSLLVGDRTSLDELAVAYRLRAREPCDRERSRRGDHEFVHWVEGRNASGGAADTPSTQADDRKTP